MTNRHEVGTLRRYVLGTSTAQEVERIEADYFERAEVLEQLSAVEEELIEDYLSGALGHTDREQFESHYLSTPTHRRRVAVVRGLRNASEPASSQIAMSGATPAARSARQPKSILGWWAIAASLVLLVGSGTWLLWPERAENTISVHDQRPSSTPATQAPPVADTVPRQPSVPSRGTPPIRPSSEPVVVAVTISPVLVRSADGQPAVAIAKGTDVLRLQLRGQTGERLQRGRSVIRTIDGHEVWRGPVMPVAGSPKGVLARVDVPASMLRPDDYIVELLESTGGREVERYRYFLRLRTP